MNEHDYVMRDAEMAEFVDAYFKARPQLLRTRHEECLVEAGFKAAWKPAAPAPIVPDGCAIVSRTLTPEAWKRLCNADIWPVTPKSFQRMLDVLMEVALLKSTNHSNEVKS